MSVRAWTLLVALAVTLAIAACAPVGWMRMALFAAASGIGPLLFVRSRWAVSEVLMVPLAASVLVWAALGMIPEHPPQTALAAWVLMIGTAGMAVVAWRRQRRIEIELSILDAAPVLAASLAAVPIAVVFAHNGLQGDRYVAHGWFNLDSFYLFALAQESVERGGWPGENPFIAGVPNHYPSFLHVGLAALASHGSPTVAIALTRLAPFLLVTSIGLWVVACARAAEARSFSAASAAGSIALVGMAGAVALRPDLFIYPQTQAFAFAWLALLVWLTPRDPADAVGAIAAGIVALAIVLAHIVTGAAAVVFAATAAVRCVLTRGMRRHGVFAAAGVVMLAGVFWWTSTLPYGATRGPFTLSSVADNLSALVDWRWPLVGIAIAVAAGGRHALPALGCIGLGVAYYLYGTTLTTPDERTFVVFNVGRFFVVALLLVLPAAVRGDRRIGLAAVLVLLVGAIWRPSGLAKASARLVDGPAVVVDAPELALFDRIRHELPVDARILTPTPGPTADYALPAFTGRAQSPTQANIWGMNTLPALEYESRLHDVAIFPSLPPTQWPEILDRWGYTHVLARIPTPPGLDGPSASRWVQERLPPGELAVQMTAGDLFLIRRTLRSR